MKSKSKISVLLALLALLVQIPVARAHQPYCEFADLTADAPWQVPDPTISYAYFGNVYPAGDIDYFSFEATAGQTVLISLSIPDIADIEVYAPQMAVMGAGIASSVGLDLPAALDLPEGHGAMSVPLGEAPRRFYEPFGGVYFWNYDDSFFGAPETSTYTVALWHPDSEIGRYTFVIGRREVFGGEADCFASYDEYWTPLQEGANPYRDTTPEELAMQGMRHDHPGQYEVAAADAPRVALNVFPLTHGGYNVQVETANFMFAPQNVDIAAAPGEGHAHLYVDGVKIARVYGEWHFIEALPQDAETVTAVLYTNDHRAFTVDGAKVSDSISLADVKPVNGDG